MMFCRRSLGWVFYDEVQDSISWVGPTTNRDHVTDTIAEADALWAQNYTSLFQNTCANRKRRNYDHKREFKPRIAVCERSHVRNVPFRRHTAEWLMTRLSQGRIVVASSDQHCERQHQRHRDTNDFKSVRFGLTTTLLGNGYFSFDFGTTDHAQV